MSVYGYGPQPEMLKGLQLKESLSLYMAKEIARRNPGRGVLWNAHATDA